MNTSGWIDLKVQVFKLYLLMLMLSYLFFNNLPNQAEENKGSDNDEGLSNINESESDDENDKFLVISSIK